MLLIYLLISAYIANIIVNLSKKNFIKLKYSTKIKILLVKREIIKGFYIKYIDIFDFKLRKIIQTIKTLIFLFKAILANFFL